MDGDQRAPSKLPPPRGESDVDVETYATIVVELCDDRRPREAVLAERGLDETSWAAVDARWQDRLSRAMDAEGDGVPAIVLQYADAFTRARAAARRGDAVLSVERFAEATREIQRGSDPHAALAKLGITLAQFLAANEVWTRRMVAEPDVLERFQRALRG